MPTSCGSHSSWISLNALVVWSVARVETYRTGSDPTGRPLERWASRLRAADGGERQEGPFPPVHGSRHRPHPPSFPCTNHPPSRPLLSVHESRRFDGSTSCGDVEPFFFRESWRRARTAPTRPTPSSRVGSFGFGMGVPGYLRMLRREKLADAQIPKTTSQKTAYPREYP